MIICVFHHGVYLENEDQSEIEMASKEIIFNQLLEIMKKCGDLEFYFCENTIDNHRNYWNLARKKNYNFMAMSLSDRIDENFSSNTIENLLSDSDVLHSEDFSFYLLSKKCYDDLLQQEINNEEEFNKAFNSLDAKYKRDLII